MTSALDERTRHLDPPPARPARGGDRWVGAGLALLHRFDGVLTRDLGLYAYAGQRVAAGDPPYVGVMNRSGPLAHLVPGAGAWLGDLVGVDDLLAMRVLMLVLSVALVLVTWSTTRVLVGSRAAAVLAVIVVATIPGVIFYATAGPREKTTMMLVLALMIGALATRRWATAGVCLALATLTWQPVFFAGAAMALTAVLLARGERLRAAVAGLVGGIATTAAFTVYFVLTDALPDALDGFVRIHLAHTEQPSFSDGGPEIWEATSIGLGHSTWLLVAGLAALVVVGLLHLARLAMARSDRGHEVGWADRVVLAAAVGAAAGLWWSWRTFNGWADALVLVPFAVLGIAVVAGWLVRTLPARTGVAVVTVGALALVGSGVQFSLTDDQDVLPEQRAETQAVLDVLPDATLLSIEAPQPLVLGHLRNPSQHQMFRLGLEDHVDETWPGGLAGYAEWVVDEQRPDLVAVGQGGWHDWVVEGIRPSYEPFGTSPGWYWLVRDDVDPGTLERLRAAVAG